MENRGSIGVQNLTSEGAEYTIPQGYHNGFGKVKAAITGLIASIIKAGTWVGGILGTFTSDANAVASNLLLGKTAYVNGSKITGTIPSKGAATIKPGISNQTIASGQYLSGTQTIAGDPDLISTNIKSGKNIFGIAGNSNVVDTSSGDASANQILSGKKAYVDGNLITGTMANKTGGYTTDSLTKNGNELRMSIDSAGYFSDGAYLRYTDNDWIEANIKSGVNIFGKTGTHEITIVAGNDVLAGSDPYIIDPSINDQSSYTKIIEKTVNYPCDSLRITFSADTYRSNTYENTYFRIYKNGSPIGIERVKTYTGSIVGETTWTEDFNGFESGDKIQVYAKGTGITYGTKGARIRSFIIKYQKHTIIS